MDLAAKLDSIPRGNTCPGVNRAIIEYLLTNETKFADKAVLDVPCGRGEFLDVIKAFFPKCHTFGADVVSPNSYGVHALIKNDLSDDQPLEFENSFSLVT